MKTKEDLIKEAKYIIELYGDNTVATIFAQNVLDLLCSNTLPDRNKKVPTMTHIPDSSGM